MRPAELNWHGLSHEIIIDNAKAEAEPFPVQIDVSALRDQ